MLKRKVMLVPKQTGQTLRVSVGAKQSSNIDPSGVLAVPPTDSKEEIKEAMSKFIQQYKNGEIKISYP
ncbi:hypothetical protein CBW65_08885 [Tumebacillus avium]|uniref:Uncharacterized protein n=1 Tax=Tumebacillus avium TaxID=1903704 RepID=A0A1Y0IKV4_9BACL|nr:hypothetical protein [Tumebacillus avium]ARU61132.1 hypothetical protein CBW65_08885 [Tumebacillus avium]